MRAARLALDRVLAAADRLDSLLADGRLGALLAARRGRPLALTVALAADTEAAGARHALERAVGARALARLEAFAVAARSSSMDTLLAEHDVLIAAGPEQPGWTIAGWQAGLCVVSSPEHAAAVANFADDYAGPEDGSAGQRRWYSRMEGRPVVITHPERIRLEYGARINPRAVIHNDGEIVIGRGSLLGADAELNLHTARFTMGQFCHTSSYLAAIGSRHTLHHPTTFAVSRGPYAFLGEPADKVGDIRIGNDVWIGTRVVLLPGAQIADGCVVGSGSIVTGPLEEPYGIYAGNPARLLRLRFPAHVVKWFCALEWWNWSTQKLLERREFFRIDIADQTEDQLWRLVGD